LAKRAIIDFLRTNRSNGEIIKLEDSIVNYTSQLTSNSLLAGTVIGPFQLAAGVTQSIYHGLGRAFVGWIVVDKDAASDVFKDTTAPDSPTLSIPLQAVSNVNVTLYVF